MTHALQWTEGAMDTEYVLWYCAGKLHVPIVWEFDVVNGCSDWYSYVVLPTPKHANSHTRVHSAYMIGGMSMAGWLP